MKIFYNNRELEIRFVKNIYDKEVPEYYNIYTEMWERSLQHLSCTAEDDDFDFYLLIYHLLITLEEHGKSFYDDYDHEKTYEMGLWEEYGEFGMNLYEIE